MTFVDPMRAIARLLPAIVYLLLNPIAAAQEDTAHHRAVYQEINKKTASLKKVTGTHTDEPLVFALTGWKEGDELRKIVATSGEDGGGFEEYYLENEKPLFVYSTYHQVDPDTGKGTVRIENRLYFKEGRVFKWLTTDKAVGVVPAGDYAGETERLISNCTAFVAALK